MLTKALSIQSGHRPRKPRVMLGLLCEEWSTRRWDFLFAAVLLVILCKLLQAMMVDTAGPKVRIDALFIATYLVGIVATTFLGVFLWDPEPTLRSEEHVWTLPPRRSQRFATKLLLAILILGILLTVAEYEIVLADRFASILQVRRSSIGLQLGVVFLALHLFSMGWGVAVIGHRFPRPFKLVALLFGMPAWFILLLLIWSVIGSPLVKVFGSNVPLTPVAVLGIILMLMPFALILWSYRNYLSRAMNTPGEGWEQQ